MITDLMTGGNQDLGFSAMIASSKAGLKGKNLSELDGVTNKAANSMDFSTLLSQTIDSGFAVDSQNSFTNVEAIMNSVEVSTPSFALNSQLKSSFKTDTFNSSPFVNLSERNSFQKSFEVKSSKEVGSTTNDAKAVSEKKDTANVSKETKKDDTDKTQKADNKESEKTQNVEESSNEEKVVEENVVTEVAMEAEAIDENIVMPEIVEEEVAEVAANVFEDEMQVEVKQTVATDSEEKTALKEDDKKDEDVEEVKVSTEEKTNPEIFAQNLQNSEQKTEVKEEKVETEEKVEAKDSVKTETKVETNEKDVKVEAKTDEKVAKEEVKPEEHLEKKVEVKEVKPEEHLEEKVEVKEEKPEEKLAVDVVNQMQQSDTSEETANVLASNQTHDTENNKKSKVVEEGTKEEVEETTDETQVTKTEISAKDTNEKSNSNQEKDSKLDKVVQEMKKSDTVLPEESLRQKFAEALGQDKHQNVENPDMNLAQQQFAGMTEQASQSASNVTSAADEAANKIFEALTGKSEGLNGKQSQTHTVIGGMEGSSKGFAMNQNNGSGMNNGFSFQSGASQTYNENGKMAQTQNGAPITSFSELLTKAEMVKTKDGAKVMNIELEQEGMGKLEVELTSKDGEVTAKLSAESDLAKAKLEELAPQIKENLLEKGVNLTQINVDVSSRDADDNSEKYLRFGKKGKSNRLNGIESNSVKDIIEEKILPNIRREALNIQSVDLTV